MITLIDDHTKTKRENLVPQKLYQGTEIHLRTFEQCPAVGYEPTVRTVGLRSPFTYSAGIVWGMLRDRVGFIQEREGFPGPASSQYEHPE